MPADRNEFNLSRRFYLSALHSLENKSLSEKKNKEIFGPCFRLHGHDYKIDVTVKGTVHPDSGLLLSRDEFDKVVNEKLIGPFHKTNLNDHFKNTSGEALALEFYNILVTAFPSHARLIKVSIQETSKNRFETTGVSF